MTERQPTHNLRLIFGLAALLLLWVGLQAAYSYTPDDSYVYHPEVRVDRCHLDIDHTNVEPCCQSDACHSTAPLKRDLDGPSYHTLQTALHLLIHESQTHTPQLKVGSPLKQTYSIPQQVFSRVSPPESPFQSLYGLKTIVLLQ